MSRTPINEAFKVLASEGLVELCSLRGAVVKTINTKDAIGMLKVMGLIESYTEHKALMAE